MIVLRSAEEGSVTRPTLAGSGTPVDPDRSRLDMGPVQEQVRRQQAGQTAGQRAAGDGDRDRGRVGDPDAGHDAEAEADRTQHDPMQQGQWSEHGYPLSWPAPIAGTPSWLSVPRKPRTPWSSHS